MSSARAAPGPGGHPWPAWFQDTVQHAQLLTNRTLRNYLLAHGDAERWPELVKATLLYGVLCIQRDFPGQAAVPLDSLREACRALHAEAAVTAALPRIRSQFASLEAEVGGFLDENTTARGAQEPTKPSQQEGHKAAAAAPNSCSGAAASAQRRPARPPTGGLQRAGSTAGTAAAAAPAAVHMPAPPPRPKQPAIYPDWWPGAAEGAGGRRPSGGPVAARRPPPRLAYSRPPTAPASVTQDDLPTAAFLLVPPRVSTGRGAAEAGGGGGARQAQQAQSKRPPESRVKLQHAQRLEVQRELQRAREVRLESGASTAAGSWCGDDAAEATAAAEEAGSPHYDPAAVARWMAHFGV